MKLLKNIRTALLNAKGSDVGAKTGYEYVFQLLHQHFNGLAPDQIVTASRTFPARMRADIQYVLNREFIPNTGKMAGIHIEYSHEEVTFSSLMQRRRQPKMIAPLQYEDIDIGDDQPVKCLLNGVLLFTREQIPLVMLVSKKMDHYGGGNLYHVEIAAPAGREPAALVDEIFLQLEKAIVTAHSYRGKILSLEQRYQYSGTSSGITVHKLAGVTREDIVLPESTLRLLERNIIEFVEQRQRLNQLGMSVKKGLLFFGPPGTGKTHTVHYLADALPEHTTLLITAEQIGLVAEYFTLARLLQPAILVIEDVDLIARDRATMQEVCEEVLLNQLLNEMDGLKPDAEIICILTTNRPETLEMALAARPGRVDQAIEFPLSDEQGREQLINLYAYGLQLNRTLTQTIVKKPRASVLPSSRNSCAAPPNTTSRKAIREQSYH